MPQAEVNGVTLEYAWLGEQSVPVIVLIRGLGTQMIEWPATFLEGLQQQGLSVLIFDNRDVGLSSKCTADYALSDMAADVVALMDHCGIPRAHIFGISLGGMVAQLLGIEHGPRVDCLFSVMSGSGNPDVPTVSADMLPYLVEQASGREAVIALSARNRALFGSPGYPESEAHRRAQSTAAYDRCYCPEGTARQMRAATADGSRVERLATIRRPTLVIHGEDDPLVSVAAGRDTAAHIPGAELEVIAGMGHNIPVALGARLAELTTAFIARHSS
ncbi:MAG: alpha/beta hydrolase [Pseudomonadota bacterium]